LNADVAPPAAAAPIATNEPDCGVKALTVAVLLLTINVPVPEFSSTLPLTS
jgi:hypothetical protein